MMFPIAEPFFLPIFSANLLWDEVFTLIGNAHFGFLDPESAKDMIASSSVGVDEDFFFYYILSSGDVLEIQYDKKTNCVCKLRQITGVEFIALYPADHSK